MLKGNARIGWVAVAALTATFLSAAGAWAQDRIGWITLDGMLTEKPSPMAWLGGSSDADTLRGLLNRFEDAAERDDIVAVMVHCKDLQANLAQVESIRQGIQHVREAGKTVHVFSEVYGPWQLLIGCAADEIIIQPGGFVSFPGLYSEEYYLADTLKHVGIVADFVQVGDYKGASEALARNAPSKEWSQNIDALLDDLWAQMTQAVKEGRGYSDEELQEVLEQAWALDSEEAIELDLVDTALDILELTDYVEDRYGGKVTQALGVQEGGSSIDFENPFAIFSLLSKKPDTTPKRPTIAVVHIDGPIVDGDSAADFFGGESVGSRTIREALKKIEDEELIEGLVVRINSPGGSAIASEMIWQGVRRVAESKPVYVSVGSMAASGGYYIAVSGDRIFVEPNSIVGSIGVVGGKLVMGGLYDKIDLGVTTRARGPRAMLFGSVQPWTEEQREMVRQMMADTYDLFSSRVTQARKGVDMSKIAEGRLFTGRQAIENGMADGLAGFEQVIERLASDVGLGDGEYDVMTYPGPKSFEEILEEMFPFVAAPNVRSRPIAGLVVAETMRGVLGDRAWESVRSTLGALMTLRDDPVALTLPRAIVIEGFTN